MPPAPQRSSRRRPAERRGRGCFRPHTHPYSAPRFGIAFANVGPFVEPRAAASFAKAAEDSGFESLWTVEHVVVPSDYKSPYP